MKIKITLNPRDENDSAEILIETAELLSVEDGTLELSPQEEIQIDASETLDCIPPATIQETYETLENRNEAIERGLIPVESKETAIEANINFRETFKDEIIRMAVRALPSVAIDIAKRIFM